jgi:glutamate synthase (NADPH/NADH) small chain
MVYRRGAQAMSASPAEQDWAQTRGVSIRHWLAPVEILGASGHVCAVRFERQTVVDGKLSPTGEFEVIEADMVLKAIGQQMLSSVLADAGVALTGGRIATDEAGLTSRSGVWAGGDCRAGGLDLTVEAVAHGKQSAQAIHTHLMRS